MARNPDTPLPKELQRSLAEVTAVSEDRIVTVKFADIPSNHPAVRGKSVGFKIDLRNTAPYRAGDWVTTHWTSRARRTTTDEITVFKTEGKLGPASITLVEKQTRGNQEEPWTSGRWWSWPPRR